jgi:acyl-CoA thioester hydrolase
MSTYPLSLYTATVLPEWLDVNDHMNVAFYALVFDQASERFMEHLGVDNDYIGGRNASWVALESHTTFGRELRLGDPLRVTAQVLDADAKRIHLFQVLYHAERGYQAATNELMILHVDLERRRAAPFPPEILGRLEEIAAAHRQLSDPPERGRSIGLRRNAG